MGLARCVADGGAVGMQRCSHCHTSGARHPPTLRPTRASPAAGILGRLQAADKVSSSVWHEVMDTNVHGVYNCCRAVYPHMKAAGGGKVVIISSIAGIRGWHRGACSAAIHCLDWLHATAGLSPHLQALLYSACIYLSCGTLLHPPNSCRLWCPGCLLQLQGSAAAPLQVAGNGLGQRQVRRRAAGLADRCL